MFSAVTPADIKGAIISCGDRPSRASIMDFDLEQFVLVKARNGPVTAIHLSIASLMCSTVGKIDTGPDSLQYTKLRGVRFDEERRAIEFYIQVLHTLDKTPVVDNTIFKLENAVNNNLFYNCAVELSTFKCDFNSDEFSPLSDAFYESVKQKMLW
jgi:hypothetical protein